MTKIAHLTDRALLRISGDESIAFLQNLITCDVENLGEGGATFGALLTPQGKLLFDFFVLRVGHEFIFDVDAAQRDALMKRLTFYKLRADVTIEPTDEPVFAAWAGAAEGTPDPRLASLGSRIYSGACTPNSDETAYHAHRIALGIPESGKDFSLNDVFPHDVSMDQFGEAGVDFSKGCYVGQEVVSRMKHRGTARSRIVHVSGGGVLPEAGTEILVDDRAIGKMGSSVGQNGLAIVRLDRAKKALDGGQEIIANDVKLEVRLPDFVSYGWPG